MRSLFYVAAIFGMLLGHSVAGCQQHAVPLPDTIDCVGACARMSADGGLGCEDGKPTPAGVPCAVWFCASPISSARAACVSRASSCAAAEACK